MKQLNLTLIVIGLILSLFSCHKNNDYTTPEPEIKLDSVIHITIFYTNDEHGWMAPSENDGGAAGIMYKWVKKEGYDESDNYLVLSGGDMWTGPSISTWFQGESMVEVMNAMNYDAAAIGNHEFDYTVDVLEQRLSEQDFPLLASNIEEKATNEIPDFATPYIIKEVNGVKVGIIGLASRSTPATTFPANVTDYRFTDYTAALDKYAYEVKKEGATVLIVIGHICSDEMNNLVSVARRNGICMIGGGHCHEEYLDKNNGVVLIEAGSGMKGYGKVEFDYYTKDSTTSNFKYKIVKNTGNGMDSGIQEIVDKWEAATNDVLSEQIAYTDVFIGQASTEMQNMVCDSWLYRFPEADISFTNGGGIRQSISKGAITLNSIVGALPFENTIVKIELTGKQVKKMSLARDICMGGMTTIRGFFLSDGTAINDNQTYTVLTTDYLYLLNEYKLSTYDPAPEYTNLHYREPVIEWMRSVNSSTTDPLSNYLDYVSRRQKDT